MSLRKPSAEDLTGISEQHGIKLSAEEVRDYRDLMASTIESYERLDEMADPKLPVTRRRTPGHRPTQEEDPLNAWYQKCSIEGGGSGLLSGKRVGIKDNVCVAGVQMTNGSSVMRGYVPDVDATIVTRILEAGGEIVGKTACESFCFSGGSHTSEPMPVHNPHNPRYSAGGSSSGSGAAVVAGDCDVAIGGDQGGSIRMPASWCGCYGLKPTHGLVPYTGIFPIEPTLDHTGPMARTVEDVALTLQVLAGPDGLDPRQKGVDASDYGEALTGEIDGMRIGVVTEGFGREGSEQDVDGIVREAAEAFGGMGAAVEEVSIPMHLDGVHVWNGIALEGTLATMVKGEGMGTGWKGYYNTGLVEFYARAREARANDFPATLKMVILLAEYAARNYPGRYYAKAQNLARELKAAYDRALADFDLLLMPTTPIKAQPLPEKDASVKEYVQSGLGAMLLNTCPFDVTGHPAISVPCGFSDGLPVGAMLIGKDYDEKTVLRAAHAFEQGIGEDRRAKGEGAFVATG